MAEKQRKIKDDILLRVRALYMLFILVGLIILLRLICVQFFSRETRVNAEKLDGKIFTEKTIHAHRGTIYSRTGDPLAISIFRYTVMFDFGCEGFDNDQTFREQSDSLSKLLARFFKDRTAREYYDKMISERSKRFKVRYIKDTVVPRSEGFIARLFDRMHGEEFKTVKLYDTIRDHTPVRLFRDVDYNEWPDAQDIPAAQLEHGCRLRHGQARQPRIPASGPRPLHHRPQQRDGRHIRPRTRLPRGAQRQGRTRVAPAHSPRFLGPCRQQDQCRCRRRHGPLHHTRHRHSGGRRQGPARTAPAQRSEVGHDHRHGGRDGRHSGHGQPQPQLTGRICRELQPRDDVAHRTGLDIQARLPAGACGRGRAAALDNIRHRTRQDSRGRGRAYQGARLA